MYNRTKFLEQEKIAEDLFYNFFKNEGYFTRINDDIKNMGYGGFAVKDDKFALIFNLHSYPYPKSFMISAEDRNGNQVIIGETVAVYSYSPDDKINDKELQEKFKIMLNDIYSKYKNYSKENRLDFAYNELEVERKDYSKIKLHDLKQTNIDLEEEIEK